jgi:hypothetical protein
MTLNHQPDSSVREHGSGTVSVFETTAPRMFPRGWFRVIGFLLVLVAVEVIYVIVVSAGHVTGWPTYMAYNDLLAEGFRSGHLHLSLAPAPELIAAENPFDPKLSQLWLGDASYYRGHFYLYFGPVPALLLAGAKTLFRISWPVGDQFLVFAFFSIAAVAGGVLIHRMTARLFIRPPFVLVAGSILALALTNPILHLLASSSIYQSAVSGGQAFMLAGVALGFEIVSAPPARGPRTWQLLAAGTAFALAIGCRLTLAPAIGILVAITTVWTGLGDAAGRWRRMARTGALLAGPVILGSIGLLIYNKLRFDAWLDFGHGKQMTTWPVRMSARYFAANAFSYLARAPEVSCHFPYALLPYEMQLEKALPNWIPRRDDYTAPEPVAGFLITSACSWAIPAALISAFGRFRILRGQWRADERWASDKMIPSAGVQARNRVFLWCVTTFVVMGTVAGAIPLVFYMATMRYLVDMSFGWALLGILGMWSLFGWAQTRPKLRRLVVCICTVLCMTTVVFGLLLGYQGYGGHFQRSNTALHERLDRALSVCPGDQP